MLLHSTASFISLGAWSAVVFREASPSSHAVWRPGHRTGVNDCLHPGGAPSLCRQATGSTYDISGGEEGAASLFEGIFAWHHSGSDSEDALLLSYFPYFPYSPLLLLTEFAAPSLWLSMVKEPSLDISLILALCTCKQAPSSPFLCTGSTSHPRSPSWPRRSQTLPWRPSHPPHWPQGCHAHTLKAWPLAPASPKPPWPSLGLHDYFYLQIGLGEAAENIRLTSVWNCQAIEENSYYGAAACSKGWRLSTCCSAGLSPASSLLWPMPGTCLRFGAYSQSLLPKQNKFTQLQPEGLQTIHFLISFPW